MVLTMGNAFNNFPKTMHGWAKTAWQREAEEFSQWSGLPEPVTEEDHAAWSRILELYKFLKWVKDHKVCITEVSTDRIVAAEANGRDERRFAPEKGLAPEYWPYLRAALVPEDDDTVHTDRCEIVESILRNTIHRRGHSVSAAFSAVDQFVNIAEESGLSLWAAVEELTFAHVIECLDERAGEIDQELREHESEAYGRPRPRAV